MDTATGHTQPARRASLLGTGLTRTPRRRGAGAVAVVLAAAVVFWYVPTHPSFDDLQRRRALVALFASGSGIGMKYSMVMPVVAALPYRVATALGIGGVVRDHFDVLLWVPWTWFVGSRLARLRGARFAVGVVTLSTVSMFAAFVTTFNAEAFSLMFVSAGMLLAVGDVTRRATIIGAVLVTIGIANIPVQIAGAAVAGMFLWWRRRKVWLLLAVMAAVIVQVVDASWTLGHFAVEKYPTETVRVTNLLPWGTVSGFNYPIVFGLAGILVSLGRGIVWFQPGLFVRNQTAEDPVRTWRTLLTVMVVVMIPIYAKWWAWYGGFTFGPRFFLLGVVPAAVALCDRIRDARTPSGWAVGAVLALWSAWVAIVGVLYFITPKANHLCRIESFRYEPLCWWVGDYSPLLAPRWDRSPLTPAGVVFSLVAGAAALAVVVLLTPPERWNALRRKAHPSSWNDRGSRLS